MDVEELLLTIHAAPLKGDGWAQALSGLADLVRADSAVLFEPQNPSPQFAIAHRLDPSGLVQYAAHYHRVDEWIARGWQVGGFGTGNVTLGESLVSHRELRRSEFHDGFLRPQNIDHGVSVVVEGARNTADAGLTVVNLMRSSRQGAFTHKEHATLQHLARHLVTAVANSRQLARLSERNAQQALALSSVDAGAFLMDAKGLIKPINAQAERILRDGRWLAGPSLRLAPYVRSSAPIDRMLAETRLSLGARTLLERANDAQRALMMFVPLEPGVPTPIPAVDTRRGQSLLWLIEFDAAANPSLATVLSAAFGLSPAERRVVETLVTLGDLKATARRIGVSEATARNQLKSIFRKLGVRRQSEMFALVARIDMLLGSERS